MSDITNLNPEVPSQIVAKVTFPQFINQLGIIPTSYKDSMSYYETLAWLCKYLEETVIPTVNQNGEAVEELQGLYVELKDYVDNYFDSTDFQEKVNTKLDEMSEDGTLTNLIKDYVDPIYEAYESEINQTVLEQNGRITTVEQIVSQMVTSNPEFVASVDDMIDTTKIYVLTTNGHVYYYNGTAWTDSGLVYGASSLSFTGAIIVNSTSDLDDINNALVNRVYVINSNEIPNLPITGKGTLLTFNYQLPTSNPASRNGEVQIYITSGNFVYERIYWAGSWLSWKQIINDGSKFINDNVLFTGTTIVSSTLDLDDLNNADVNKSYLIFSTDVANLPSGKNGELITFRYLKYNASQKNGTVQIFIDTDNNTFIRHYYGNIWRPWKQIAYLENVKYRTYDYSTVAIFQNIGVIGDSFASGEVEGSGDLYNISWPQILARKNGATAINFSAGGLSCRTWLTHIKGLTLLNSSEAQQLYMIALGINDIGEITGSDPSYETLGTIEDIDLENPSSNPNTFYGNYGKILSAIKTKAPDSKIILITIPKTNTGNNKTINDAIIEIGETYDLPVIISHNNPIFTSTYFTNEKSANGHPTSSGYGTMALAYELMLEECIASYYEYFKDYTPSNS